MVPTCRFHRTEGDGFSTFAARNRTMGASEIVFIFLIYLLLFGAKGVPSLARTMGKAIRQFREASSDIQREIMSSANEVKSTVNRTIDEAMKDQPESNPPQKPEDKS
jgi:sec-independent protein translocase protein TatA